jgi:hypothetical protein
MAWKPVDVRAYRDRDWGAFERAPRIVLDAARSTALAGALYEEVRAAIPGWPTGADRDEDLRVHVRLVETFARIHDAERRRVDPR